MDPLTDVYYSKLNVNNFLYLDSTHIIGRRGTNIGLTHPHLHPSFQTLPSFSRFVLIVDRSLWNLFTEVEKEESKVLLYSINKN